MADAIDEARIIAWIDGELPADEAAAIAALVKRDKTLAALADRHRRLRARFAAAFAPIAAEPVETRPAAPVISLAAARAARDRDRSPPRRWRRWGWPGAVAASLLLGLAIGQHRPAPGVGDRPGALTLDRPIAAALDTALSGDAGPLRIALSFRDRQGDYCRSFSASHVSGVACRDGRGWELRYGSQGQAATDYRMAGGDAPKMAAIDAMIDGAPLDRTGEIAMRRKGWR